LLCQGHPNMWFYCSAIQSYVEKWRANRLQSQYEDEAEFLEIPLVADDIVIGKKVADIAPSMPRDCILVSIQRDGHVVIPQGNTVFQTGDLVTAFVRKQKANELFHCLHGPEKT
jgi:Trk K+ transport system NAD-binding subunit